MLYLENTLPIKISYSPWKEESSLPYILLDQYRFKMATIGTIAALFIFPKEEIGPISTIKKHIALIKNVTDVPLVFILDKCTAKQRAAFLENNIFFVVDNKQIYLPFLGIILQESFSKEASGIFSLLPSTQMLLFYYIYQRQTSLPMNHISDRLKLSAMSISRSVQQLEETKLFHTYKVGVNKFITSDYFGYELYNKAQPFLLSPIKKQGYIDKDINISADKAGLSALSKYTMLNPPKIETYAILRLPNKSIELEKNLLDAENQIKIQLWHYQPQILSKDGYVDILSLHQSLKEEKDDRIKKEVNLMMNQYWEDYHGKRIRTF